MSIKGSVEHLSWASKVGKVVVQETSEEEIKRQEIIFGKYDGT